MKTAKAFVAIAMMGLLAASCSSESTSESTPVTNNDEIIKFATNTQPVLQSKAVNNPANLQDQKFLENEPINVYITKHGTNDLLLPRKVSEVGSTYYKFTVGAAYTGTDATENSQYLTAPNGYTFQYPGTDAIDVYAIHPASTGANVDKASTTFSVKDDQTADADYVNSDLITATAGNKTKTDGTILLTFAHKLSKVVVKLQVDPNQNQGIDLENAKISINGNKTVALTHSKSEDTGETTLTLGETSNSGSITIGTYDEQNGTAGIIIPQKAAKDQKLISVTLANGATFSYTPAEEEEFEAEKEYVYTLTLKAELLSLVSIKINPWTTVQRTGDAILD